MRSFLRGLIAALIIFPLLPLAASDYHLSPEIKAVTVYTPAPSFPYDSYKPFRGTVTVRLDVDKQSGTVKKVELTRSSGYGRADDAVMSALRRWRFKPGTVDHVEIPMGFYDFDPEVSYSYFGTIKAIDAASGKVTLLSKMGAKLVVTVTARTRILSSAGQATDIRQLAVGSRVHGQATMNAEHVVFARTMELKPASH